MRRAMTAVLVAACALGVASPTLAGTRASEFKLHLALNKGSAFAWAANQAHGKSNAPGNGKGKGHEIGKGKGHGNGRGKGHMHDCKTAGC